MSHFFLREKKTKKKKNTFFFFTSFFIFFLLFLIFSSSLLLLAENHDMTDITIHSLLTCIPEEASPIEAEQSYWRDHEKEFSGGGGDASNNKFNFEDPILGRAVILNTRLPLPKLNKVHVGPSKIHGQGVFASRDIVLGEVITLYPGDFVNVMYPTSVPKINNCLVLRGDHLPEDATHPPGATSYVRRCDSLYSIAGHPECTQDPAYLGHMINDGAMSHRPEDRAIYESVSCIKSNCDLINVPPHQPFFVAVVAMKSIRAGEEILTHYGYEHWAHIRKV